jgi:TolB-like protein/Tfp pilus assembly protein PilF
VIAAPPAREDESTWTRLRRRKVVQWGVAYSAGAWGFLQGLAYLSTLLNWPAQMQRLTGLALLIGLPIALVLAWYHGDRGEQRVGRAELAILTLLFLLGGGLFWRYQHTSETPGYNPAVAPEVAKPATTASADSRPSIAVLPFENRSRIEDDLFFVDGIHDDILTQLTKIGALKVIARTSVEQFRDSKLTTKAIGEKLGVTKVLEGGVQRAGDRVRVTVQLIDAATDAHLWAESYDRELSAANIFAIQSEVAAAIAAALEATLTTDEQARAQALPTQNLKAWEAYQLGKQRLAKRASTELVDAEEFFREAIDLDPRFALAYVGLADAYTLQVEYSGAPSESTVSKAAEAVSKALELDPKLAEAWASSGLIAARQLQFDRAESMYRRAIALNPNYAPARLWYGNLLEALGRLDESVAQIQRALELDPLSAVINENLGDRLALQGRFHEAGALYRRAITIDPSRPGSYLALARLKAYAFNAFVDAVSLALKAMELDSGSPMHAIDLAFLYFDLGDDKKFFETTAQAAKRWPDSSAVQYRFALSALLQGHAAGAARHAQRTLDKDPRHDWALEILRNADLHSGRYEEALGRYEKAYPELFAPGAPRIDTSNAAASVDLAVVYQKRGDRDRTSILLDGAERVSRLIPRLGMNGHGIEDVQIHALRGSKAQALAALRESERAGWRFRWRYYREFDPALDSIRNEPEFKAVFADIERDMAQQRARLAARPKDAPLAQAAR